MSLFRRNRNVDTVTVPEEVNSYYQAEKRDKKWMALLLALFALAASALVVVALFFGGRWAYRKFRPTTTTSPVTIQKPSSPIAVGNDKPSNGTSNSSSGTSNGSSATSTPSPTSGNVNAPSSSTPPSSPGTTLIPGQASPQTAPTPAVTSTSNGDLPKTGPGDVVAIFVLTSLAGGIVYRYLLRQTYN